MFEITGPPWHAWRVVLTQAAGATPQVEEEDLSDGQGSIQPKKTPILL